MTLLLIIIILVLAIGAAPRWNHSPDWGWWPSIILIILLVYGLLRYGGLAR